MAKRDAGHGYLLDNQQSEAGIRFDALSELFDPVTFRHIDQLGITEGMRCWEVGAGGPPVPLGLAERVGPTGRVVATDIDVSWIRHVAGGVIEVLRHDVATDPPPPGGFDLVHARLVLVHVTDRTEALRRMVRALRPGGRLLLEDADPGLQPLLCPEESGPEQRLANRLRSGFRTLMAARGADLAYGRTLPGLLKPVWTRCRRTRTSRSPRRHAPSSRPRPCGRSVAVWWGRGSPPTRRSTGTWRTSPPANSTWPPPR